MRLPDVIETLPRAFGIIALALSLTSCVGVYNHEYPSQWAALKPVEKDDCPNISGSYSDWGLRSAPKSEDGAGYCDGKNNDCSLSFILMGKNRSFGRFKSSPTKIEVKQTDNELEILIWSGNEIADSRKLYRDRGEYRCGAEGLTISNLDYVGGVPGVAAAYVSTFNKSEDGTLVMKDKQTVVGLHIFLPVAAHLGGWVRWQPREN